MSGQRTYIDGDWYGGGIPPNVSIGKDVYIDSSYGFAPFSSRCEPGLILGDACGAYDRATFVAGPESRISVGPYTVLNGTYLICGKAISIGAHCLLAWGVVITDTWLAPGQSMQERRALLRAASADPLRRLPPPSACRPVRLDDNVWIGFDSVVMPGVTIGRGSIVGCKTVIETDIPPYTVIAGNPARILWSLGQDDNEQARQEAFREYIDPTKAGANLLRGKPSG